MPDQHFELSQPAAKVLPFPVENSSRLTTVSAPIVPTPIYDKLVKEAHDLQQMSAYKSDFDYDAYRQLEVRFSEKSVRGGIICKTDLKLANFHPSCFKCHYSLELDTYGRGCVHECAYCYAKDELSLHGYWNNPIPLPININELRKVFYKVFETDEHSKWREILSKRIPIRIGSMSDSFMWMDLKYKVTLEVIKLLNFYEYPHIIFTRSDLVAHDLYLKALNPNLTSVQFSICGNNDDLTRAFEPGAPNIKRRFAALQKLGDAGIRTAVRINPLFPTYPDGYFTDHDSVVERFGSEQNIPRFDFFNIDRLDEFFQILADAKVRTALTGFVRLKSSSLNLITKQTGVDLKPFFRPEVMNTGLRGNREKKYSDKEIAYYYQKLWGSAKRHGINFSTCYIGNGAKDYYQYQNLWDNKKDCCDVRGNVASFASSAQDIPWSVREKFTPNKVLSEESRKSEIELDKKYLESSLVKQTNHSLNGLQLI